MCKQSLTFPTSRLINKAIQRRDLSLLNINHFQLDSRFDKSDKTQPVLIFKQLLCCLCSFCLDGNMGWWFDAEGSCTFQTCHHVLPQALQVWQASATEGLPSGSEATHLEKNIHHFSTYLTAVKLTVFVALLIKSSKKSTHLAKHLEYFWMA